MNVVVDISGAAERDIVNAHTFYKSVSLQIADGFLDRLDALFRQICIFPESGSARYVHLLKTYPVRNFRLADYPYIIIYSVHTKKVRIERCIHARADILAILTSSSEYYGEMPNA